MQNQLDLHVAASTAAKNSLAAASDLAIDSAMLEAFTASGADPLDYDMFKSTFTSQRKTYADLQARPLPSILAAQKAKLAPAAPAPAGAPLTGKQIVTNAATN